MNIKFPPEAAQRILAAANKAASAIASEAGSVVAVAVAATTLGWVLELLESEKREVAAADVDLQASHSVIDYVSIKAKVEKKLEDPLADNVELAVQEEL